MRALFFKLIVHLAEIQFISLSWGLTLTFTYDSISLLRIIQFLCSTYNARQTVIIISIIIIPLLFR